MFVTTDENCHNVLSKRECEGSQVSEYDYVKQETPNSCGVAAVLLARNLLAGRSFPYTVTETLDLMQQKGYPPSKLGRTNPRDRRVLVSQLNELQDIKLTYKKGAMPEAEAVYMHELENLLRSGAVVLAGFKKPYFELPQGAEGETHPDSFHGAVIHGTRSRGTETSFIVTDPDGEVTHYFGRNIEVTADKLYSSLSDYSKNNLECVSVE
jgi:hypothetical protein